MTKNYSLRKKILHAMITLVSGMLAAAVTIVMFTMRSVSDTLVESNRNLSETIGKQSKAYMSEQSQYRMLELAGEKAQIADSIFAEFESSVNTAASVAGQIYNHPELYPARYVPLPDASKDGELSIQVLYSAAADPSDPAVIEELGLLGNVQDTLMAVNGSQENMASIYVASESGFMVQADYISAKKFDENGELMPLEAKERPWYKGAAETGKPYFTPVTKDAHTPRLGIMCGIPVYAGDKLMAVAGAGMYLDDMEELVRSVELGESGHACILNAGGQVLFSTYSEGTLAAVADAPDLRMSEDAAIASMAAEAVGGGTGTAQLEIDGVLNYAAYSPMKTVGWSMVVFISQDAVEAPTDSLVKSISGMTDQTFLDATNHARRASYMLLWLLLAAVLIAIAVSFALSNRIVKPIRTLTEEIRAIEGDNLDFTWDLDTGDETQVLAESFRSMTERLKKYVSDIESITADRERIQTELSLATRIQAAMLPNIFPPFPNRSEFDVYAAMDPAREVGGDFYDFFLIDDDHLCLVMADVSGKGVPAALMMMASKITLQNLSMFGGSPADILSKTNAVICSNNNEDMFITVWLGILELSTGILTAANAGHEYPVIKKPDGKFSLYKDNHGFVLGALEDIKYRNYEIRLEPGTKLFLYTDGVPEATNKDLKLFGTDRMLDALNKDTGATPDEVLFNIRTAVDRFTEDAEQFDDLTMLCMEYRGRDSSSGKEKE
ncbi:MAG: SpoIIE family protein phosphatase [Solobacterium sp.]|nr:SpoIIE family protein phosphatase [Solobacterium sp.]